MTELYAWLPEPDPPYLLECWLRSLPADTRVTLLISPARERLARELAGRQPNLRRWVSAAPGAPLPVPPPHAITIPRAVDLVPMRYQPALMADVPPHYALLRQVGLWGIREARFVVHKGAHTFALPHVLDNFVNRHQGRRCFVAGNGPSLNAIDMTKLKDEITLGSNRCFLGYESWGFPFTYWGVYDKFQIEEYHPVYEDNVPADTIKFFPAEYLPVLHVANGCPVHCVWPDPAARAFSDDPARVYRGFTVTFMLLQVAAMMGCDPIILIGADHRYELTRRGYSRLWRGARRALARRLRGGRVYDAALAAHRAWKKRDRAPGTPALWSTEDAANPTHFTADYTAGGRNRFLPPEPEEAERDFDCARAWAVANGRQILNATPGTALESFPKVDFESLF